MTRRAIRVLVVDDEPDVLRVVARELRQRFGWDVVAMAQPPRNPVLVDAVISDLHLTDTDGAETLEAVQWAAPGRPVIVLSGLCSPERDEAAIRAGAEAVVPKGEPISTVVREVLQALARRRRLADPEMLLSVSRYVIASLRDAGGVST
jgi:DNA-binding NarL/FixJ family response regulator